MSLAQVKAVLLYMPPRETYIITYANPMKSLECLVKAAMTKGICRYSKAMRLLSMVRSVSTPSRND